jgi:hypothetical protein
VRDWRRRVRQGGHRGVIPAERVSTGWGYRCPSAWVRRSLGRSACQGPTKVHLSDSNRLFAQVLRLFPLLLEETPAPQQVE